MGSYPAGRQRTLLVMELGQNTAGGNVLELVHNTIGNNTLELVHNITRNTVFEIVHTQEDKLGNGTST